VITWETALFLKRGETCMLPPRASNDEDHEIGFLLERTFRQGLAHKGIPCYSVTAASTAGLLHTLKVILFSNGDLEMFDRFLRGQFQVEEDSPPPAEWTGTRGLAPKLYRVSLRPSRSGLPEWKAFEKRVFLVEGNTLFGEALQSAFGALSPDRCPAAAALTTEEEERLSALAEDLNDFFSGLCSRRQVEVGFGSPAHPSAEPSIEEAGWGQDPPEDAGISGQIGRSDILLYFRTHPNILGRWMSMASESGLELLEAGSMADEGDNSRGLRQLQDFLQKKGLADLHEMASFMDEKLGSWELLYEALETARVRRMLPSDALSVCEFALVLLKARENLS
jgi:hypothetical protein